MGEDLNALVERTSKDLFLNKIEGSEELFSIHKILKVTKTSKLKLKNQVWKVLKELERNWRQTPRGK